MHGTLFCTLVRLLLVFPLSFIVYLVVRVEVFVINFLFMGWLSFCFLNLLDVCGLLIDRSESLRYLRKGREKNECRT
jgi:hypothetical protein